jgi:hypothetical protein
MSVRSTSRRIDALSYSRARVKGVSEELQGARMPFSGVRISCDMFATNRDFAGWPSAFFAADLLIKPMKTAGSGRPR